jgi:outer membrane protein OmpA-like peptidoglycan-associated protein
VKGAARAARAVKSGDGKAEAAPARPPPRPASPLPAVQPGAAERFDFGGIRVAGGAPLLQRKLAVGDANDPLEREADRVADQALRMTAPAVSIGAAPQVSRMCAACEEEEKKKLQTKRAGPSTSVGEAPPIVHEALREPGAPLDAATRAYFEPRFGRDFSGVRVHTGAKAEESAQAVNALAYTVGRDVVFGAGRYAPAASDGRRLLAHELTHVTQQGACGVSTGSLGAPLVQRQEAEVGGAAKGEPAEKPLSRAEEVQLSRTSPGKVGGGARPPVISIYNFAIDGAALKSEHKAVLAEVADLIKQTDASKVGVIVVGHADSSGSAQVNLPLSQQRAQAVKAALERQTGRSVPAEWAGDTQPAEPNDSVEGRSRNRRVDIYFRPLGGPLPPTKEPPPGTEQPPPKKEEPPPPPPPTKEPPGKEEPPKKEKEDEQKDEKWFCARHPLICAGVGVGVGVAIYCYFNPLKCLPTLPIRPPGGGGGPKKPEEKDKDKDKGERPCVESQSLPSGTIPAKAIGPFLLGAFKMRVTFKNDDTGCSCRLGEYKQEIRGFAERDRGTGVMQPADPLGLKLDRANYQEDLRGGVARYGVRDEPIGNVDKDQFLPDRDTGCLYKGADDPGMEGIIEGEHARFHFEFRGGPVDRRLRSAPIGPWSNWVVEGDYNRPKPPPSKPTEKKPPPTPVPPPKPQEQLPLPEREYQGPTIGPPSGPAPPPSDFCWGGAIACKTFDFLQQQRRAHTFLTKDDVNRAVEIEFEVLKKNRTQPPPKIPSPGEEYFAWIQSLRDEARTRVREFLKPFFAPLPD